MANPEASETGKARDVAGSPRSRSSFVERAVRYFGLCGPAEFYAASSISVLMVALKFANLFRFRFDSDESQHLHVIWGWTRGLVQYRDIFDNHMPLFHLMFAPIFGLVGEQVHALLSMRLALFPV